MTTIESVLQKYGNGIDAEDFADQLDQLMRSRPSADPRGLSSHDRRMLTAVGVRAEDLDRAGSDLVAEAAQLITINSAGLPVAAAAARLGRSVSRVRGAIADGSLYGTKVGRFWLIPAWQLDGSAPIPHLRKVIAAIPPGTSAVTVDRVMTQTTEELYLDGRAVSPRDWLIAGNPPVSVIAMVAQLYEW
ncbi:hypothetical protein [Nakamurella sp. PAMC28650]|uniref:hypothetical protein n=1 Tax=Nakamurella sp. PAMC28650 TaxID=2762325 RepID=UPI00164EBEAB|nr:hypothetical protein [Nakamurella sp. PAMC28650]QNK83257.1 hypothetical protein H7F38_11795 [Nakamurella sp. PAMC28650]